MDRSKMRPGDRVRVPELDAIGVVHQVGDPHFPGLRNAARVRFPDEPGLEAAWYPIEDLAEEGS